jgi:hypothetical protein
LSPRYNTCARARATPEKYLGLQRVVHWHVVPLPPGTPYEEQQFAAAMLETAGALRIPDKEKADLAARIGRRMDGE